MRRRVSTGRQVLRPVVPLVISTGLPAATILLSRAGLPLTTEDTIVGGQQDLRGSGRGSTAPVHGPTPIVSDRQHVDLFVGDQVCHVGREPGNRNAADVERFESSHRCAGSRPPQDEFDDIAHSREERKA